MTRTPALLFSLGIPPQQRVLLGGDRPLNEVLHDRVLRLINAHPNDNNYFAWQALRRGYAGPGDKCLPPYLQQSQFERMRGGAGRVVPVHANLRVFLESLPAREVDAVVLLDSQDWMAPGEIRALWNAIDRAGKDTVRVIFRTAGLNRRSRTRSLRTSGKRGAATVERSQLGFERDRSGIYGGFHCYERRRA